jgi:hypothetical protein
MTPKVVGIGVGLVLGIVWMWLGIWAALLTGGLALVGWFVGSLIEGTINPVDLWNALQGRRGGLDYKRRNNCIYSIDENEKPVVV